MYADYAKVLQSQGNGYSQVGRAGYSKADFAALPTETAVNSFGCGNPLAFSEVQPGEVVLDLGSGINLLPAGLRFDKLRGE